MQNKDMEIDLKYYAKVHSYESFGTVDGPGIRFVLFMQGCNLKCMYCHNRDTWDINGGNYVSLDEIEERVLKYKNYIYPKGGVTVTGGEPLLQVKFLIEFFKRLKKHGIHTCIDTAGMIQINDDIKELMKYTDLVLLDIKHIDPERCKKLVGLSNKLELNFAKFLSDSGIDMWIRQVFIPGFTDDKNDLLKLKSFIDTLKTVKKFEFLPYHSMGKYKWEKLGLNYELANVKEPTTEEINAAYKIMNFRDVP